ncbi:MAG TPA: hypothetical protein VN673_11110 [Clostridia bacterium]|nr:hypothetical protein [Clostridia bacterium]
MKPHSARRPMLNPAFKRFQTLPLPLAARPAAAAPAPGWVTHDLRAGSATMTAEPIENCRTTAE